MNTPSKQQVIDLLLAWIRQRPGLDPRDYGGGRDGFAAFRSESARISQQGRDAKKLLAYVFASSMPVETILQGFKAFSGRLEIVETDNPGEFRLSYCTGQYWPTEYRAAAAAVLASAIWAYHRPDCKSENPGEEIRAKFRRMFGKPLQSRWLD